MMPQTDKILNLHLAIIELVNLLQRCVDENNTTTLIVYDDFALLIYSPILRGSYFIDDRKISLAFYEIYNIKFTVSVFHEEYKGDSEYEGVIKFEEYDNYFHKLIGNKAKVKKILSILGHGD